MVEASRNVDKGRRTVATRYRLHAGDLLRRLLSSPRAGEPRSVRELAVRAGLSKSKIQALVNEDRPTVTGDEAKRLAGIYRLEPRALVHPVSMSMDMDDDPITATRKETSGGLDDPRRTLAPGTARGADELGEHARPAEPDGEGTSRGSRPL
jgi:plasmid maintenance system antidote protein VapI